MELIVIGESRLKIMLTGEDMARYRLEEPAASGQGGDTVTPHTREVLRHIFADAREEIGFDTEGERLFVQLYASKGGGCEIFVTKLGGAGETELLKRIKQEESAMQGERERTVCLRVGSLSDLTALCRRLTDAGFRGNSRLYIGAEADAAWYLTLGLVEDDKGRTRFPFLWEYGEEMAVGCEFYLSEHGKRICPRGAVEVMARI